MLYLSVMRSMALFVPLSRHLLLSYFPISFLHSSRTVHVHFDASTNRISKARVRARTSIHFLSFFLFLLWVARPTWNLFVSSLFLSSDAKHIFVSGPAPVNFYSHFETFGNMRRFYLIFIYIYIFHFESFDFNISRHFSSGSLTWHARCNIHHDFERGRPKHHSHANTFVHHTCGSSFNAVIVPPPSTSNGVHLLSGWFVNEFIYV